MSRPLRIEFAGALYHVTSRGDGREEIYVGENDREIWLEILARVCERFNWAIHAYCQMGNHYHLLVETPDGNLSKGMRQLNGVYTQRFNQNHSRVVCGRCGAGTRMAGDRVDTGRVRGTNAGRASGVSSVCRGGQEPALSVARAEEPDLPGLGGVCK